MNVHDKLVSLLYNRPHTQQTCFRIWHEFNYCKVLCIQVIPTYLSQKLLRSEGYVSNMEIGTNIYFFLFFICFLMSEELIDPGFMHHIGECAFWVIHQYQCVLFTWLYSEYIMYLYLISSFFSSNKIKD